MKHFASPEFWRRYGELPNHIQHLADRSFDMLRRDATHPSLQLKPVGAYWSARVGLHYRAIAVKDDDAFVWFWIGSHAQYDRLIGR